jgi:hypothetical protein
MQYLPSFKCSDLHGKTDKTDKLEKKQDLTISIKDSFDKKSVRNKLGIS